MNYQEIEMLVSDRANPLSPDKSESDGLSLLSLFPSHSLAGFRDALQIMQLKPNGKEQQDPQEKQPPVIDLEEAPKSLGTEGPLRLEVQHFRDNLSAAGINPDKMSTTILLYEPIDAHDEHKVHPLHVKDVINGREYGLSRGADVQIESPPESTSSIKLDQFLGRQDPVQEFVTAYSVASLNDLTTFINDKFLNDPKTRVLNVSQGFSSLYLQGVLMEQLEREPEKHAAVVQSLIGKEKADRWVAAQMQDNRQKDLMKEGKLDSMSSVMNKEIANSLNRELMQKIASSLDGNEEFQEALKKYQVVTKQAADRSKFIVVAAGNDGMGPALMQMTLPAEAQCNWYAMSDHVISVAGVDTNNTPGQRADDRIWDSSSPGTGRFHPIVSAQSARIPGRNSEEIQGTSFAAPQVSGTIGLMLEQNSSMTFAQVKRLLEQNCTKVTSASTQRQGSGLLEIDRAIVAARNASDTRIASN